MWAVRCLAEAVALHPHLPVEPACGGFVSRCLASEQYYWIVGPEEVKHLLAYFQGVSSSTGEEDVARPDAFFLLLEESVIVVTISKYNSTITMQPLLQIEAYRSGQ